MRISLTYMDGRAPRVIDTAGESALSGSVASSSPEWEGRGMATAAVMHRPRLDLVCEGEGLVVESIVWSAYTDRRTPFREVADVGGSWEVPCLDFHVWRAWEVLPATELEHVRRLDVDGRWQVWRVAGELCDVTCYLLTEEEMLTDHERGSNSLADRVALVAGRLRELFDGIGEDEMAREWGLSAPLMRLVDSRPGHGGVRAGRGADDGLDDIVQALVEAPDRAFRVRVLEEAICDLRIATSEDVSRACRRRGVTVEDLEGLMDEALEVLNRF